MVKPVYVVKRHGTDSRDKSERAKGDVLTQRRAQRELDEVRAEFQRLEQQLERARAGTGVKKVVLESGTSPQISALVEQLDSERKKITRLGTELSEHQRRVQVVTEASEALQASPTKLKAAEDRSAETKIELERVQQALEKSQEQLKLLQDLLGFIHGRPPYSIPINIVNLPTKEEFRASYFAFCAGVAIPLAIQMKAQLDARTVQDWCGTKRIREVKEEVELRGDLTQVALLAAALVDTARLELAQKLRAAKNRQQKKTHSASNFHPDPKSASVDQPHPSISAAAPPLSRSAQIEEALVEAHREHQSAMKRRADLKRRVEAAEARLVAKRAETLTPSVSVAPGPSASFAAQRMAKAAVSLNRQIMNLRQENLELLVRLASAEEA